MVTHGWPDLAVMLSVFRYAPRRSMLIAALARGGTVALAARWGGSIRGACMHPARSYGPALVAGVWHGQPDPLHRCPEMLIKRADFRFERTATY